MTDDIDKIKKFLRDNGANPEPLFCAMQEAIIQQIISILNLDNSLEQVSNCPSPQLQLGNDVLYEIYIFVHQKLTNPNETLIDEVKDLDFAEVMFENANYYNNNNNFKTVNPMNNNNNNNNNSGYNANNELNGKTLRTKGGRRRLTVRRRRRSAKHRRRS